VNVLYFTIAHFNAERERGGLIYTRNLSGCAKTRTSRCSPSTFVMPPTGNPARAGSPNRTRQARLIVGFQLEAGLWAIRHWQIDHVVFESSIAALYWQDLHKTPCRRQSSQSIAKPSCSSRRSTMATPSTRDGRAGPQRAALPTGNGACSSR
jgi:hypothetical protein